jgi:hypothetical protein
MQEAEAQLDQEHDEESDDKSTASSDSECRSSSCMQQSLLLKILSLLSTGVHKLDLSEDNQITKI